jgi:single-strand DNA-binding protein
MWLPETKYFLTIKLFFMQMTARLTGDAIVATVKEDKQVVNFSVALNDSYKPKGGELKKIVTFYQCAYWINPKIAPFLKKGTIVEMDGRISVNVYKNMDGEPKASLNFHVSSIKMHGGGKTTTAQPVAVAEETAQGAADDLPF